MTPGRGHVSVGSSDYNSGWFRQAQLLRAHQNVVATLKRKVFRGSRNWNRGERLLTACS